MINHLYFTHFLYEIFRTHYIFYACCPSAFGLATFQVISCHLRLYRVALGQGLANFFCEKSDRNILGLWTQFLLHSIVSFNFVSVFKDTFKNIKAIFSSCMIQLQAASGYDFQSSLQSMKISPSEGSLTSMLNPACFQQQESLLFSTTEFGKFIQNITHLVLQCKGMEAARL